MLRKRIFVALAVLAILFLQFADCMSAMTHDQQSMQCCGSMPCDPSNRSHDCCRGMVSAQSPNALPVPQATLHAPLMLVATAVGSPQLTLYTQISRFEFAAPQ